MVGEPFFGREPDLEDGRLFAWGIGAFDGIEGVHVLGSVEFTVLATMGLVTTVDFGCSGISSCLFLSSIDLLTDIPTEFESTVITRVPLPATGVLYGLALVTLGRAWRRKA